MKFFATLVAFAPAVFAAAIPSAITDTAVAAATSPVIEERQISVIAQLLLCPAINLQPENGIQCARVNFERENQCINMQGNLASLNDRISSINGRGGGRNGRGGICRLYRDINCNNSNFLFAFEYANDILNLVGSGIVGQSNDQISSISCFSN